jgi:hypothetical protein
MDVPFVFWSWLSILIDWIENVLFQYRLEIRFDLDAGSH